MIAVFPLDNAVDLGEPPLMRVFDPTPLIGCDERAPRSKVAGCLHNETAQLEHEPPTTPVFFQIQNESVPVAKGECCKRFLRVLVCV